MATKKLKSLKGRVIRVTRLNACGVAVVGTCSSVVSTGFITVTWEPEVEAGEQYTQKNAYGDPCIDEKDADYVKWVNVGISMCEVDPDLLSIVANWDPLIAGVDTIGAGLTNRRNDASAFALEVWTKQAGSACVGGSPEWGYFVGSFVKNGSVDGSIEISNGTMSIDMKGEAQPAVATWAMTPYTPSNPLLATGGVPVGQMISIVRTTFQPPTATAGCVAVA